MVYHESAWLRLERRGELEQLSFCCIVWYFVITVYRSRLVTGVSEFGGGPIVDREARLYVFRGWYRIKPASHFTEPNASLSDRNTH